MIRSSVSVIERQSLHIAANLFLTANAAILFPHRSRGGSLNGFDNTSFTARQPSVAFDVVITQLNNKMKAQLITYEGDLAIVLADSKPVNTMILAYKYLLDCLTVALQLQEPALMESMDKLIRLDRGRICKKEFEAAKKRLDAQREEFVRQGKMGRKFARFFRT